MKKVLLGATALTAAGAFAVGASPANAEFDMKIGGYQTNGFIYTSTSYEGEAAGFTAANADANSSGMSMYNDSEIHFTATQKLDNGLTITSRIELETSARDGDSTDETQVRISGGFGSVELGGNDVVSDNMHYGAPSVSNYGLSASTYFGYLGQTGGGSGGHNNASWNLGADDALGIAYYTPRIAGLQAGLGYSPNASQGNAEGATDADGTGNLMTAGVNFQTEMNGVGLNTSVGAASVQRARMRLDRDSNPRLSTINWGANVSYMGFTVGGEMARHSGVQAVNQSADATVWGLGAKYGQGPWGVSYGFLNSKGRAPYNGAGEKPKTTTHEVAGSYNLGPGVDLGLSVVLSDHVGTVTEAAGPAVGAAANTVQDDTSGVLVGSWLAVSF